MAFFIVSAWSYAVVWYVFLPEIGLKSDSKKARKWGILIGAMYAFFGCFDWKKFAHFRMFWLKKIANQFFIYTFAFESSGTYLYDPIPLIVHILYRICTFLSGFLPKYAVKWQFFHRFCRVSCGRLTRVFAWKQAEKWLEKGSKMGFLLGATLCRFAIICWYCVFPIFCDWR